MDKATANTDTATQVRFFEKVSGDILVRRVLLLDAAVTGVNGVAYLVGAGVLDSVLGLSTALLQPTGGLLLVFAAAVTYLAIRPLLTRSAVRGVIVANLIWAISSLFVAAADWFSPTTTGRIWIVVQAGTVALFAGLQHWALRRDV